MTFRRLHLFATFTSLLLFISVIGMLAFQVTPAQSIDPALAKQLQLLAFYEHDGLLRAIDTRFYEADDQYVMDRARYSMRVPTVLNADGMLSYQYEDVAVGFTPLPLQWDSGEIVAAMQEVDGQRVTNGYAVSGIEEQVNWEDRGVLYADAYGEVASLGVLAEPRKLRKITKIDAVDASDASGYLTVPFTLTVDEQTKILINNEKWNREGIISTLHEPIILERSGDETMIEPAMVWDSAGRRMPVELTLQQTDAGMVLTKHIPASFLRVATFPIYTDANVTWGSQQQFYSGSEPDIIDADELDSTHVIVAFRGDTTDETQRKVRVVAGTISGTSVTFGTVVIVKDDTATTAYATKVAGLQSDRAVVAYGYPRVVGDIVHTDLHLVGLSVAGNVITLRNTAVVQSPTNNNFSLTRLSDSTFAGVVAGISHSEYFHGSFNGTTIDVTATTVRASVNGTDMNVDTMDIDALTETKVISIGNGNSKVEAIVVDNITSQPLEGIFATVSSNPSTNVNVAALSETIAIFAYDGAVRAGSIANRTLTLGSEVTISGATEVSVTKITANRALVTYKDGSNNAISRVAELDGTTITLDTADTIQLSANSYNRGEALAFSDSKVGIAYANANGYVEIGDLDDSVLYNLPNSHDAVLVSNTATNVTVTGQSGSQDLYFRDADGDIAGKATFNFTTGNRDMTGVTYNRDEDDCRTVMKNLHGHTGIVGDITMYVPLCAGETLLRYCHNSAVIGCTALDNWSVLWDSAGTVIAQTSDVNYQLSNFGLSTSDFTVSQTTVDSKAVWDVTGPVASGGEGEGGGGSAVPEFSTWALLLLAAGVIWVLQKEEGLWKGFEV